MIGTTALHTIAPLAAATPPQSVAGLWRGGRPFIDPMDLHGAWWFTLVPLALFVSIAYKAVRVTNVPSASYMKSVLMMTVQISVGMVVLAVALHALVEFIIPVID